MLQTEFRFIRKIIVMRVAAITRGPSPLSQRYTGAKDGKCQGGLREQSNAVESIGVYESNAVESIVYDPVDC
jgi:hypothetical protein